MPVAQGVDDVAREPQLLRSPDRARSKARRDGVIDEIFGRAVAADRSARGGEHDEARRVAADDRQVQRAAAEVEDEARSRADVGRVRGRDRFSDETDLTKAGELRRRAEPGRGAIVGPG